MAQTTTELQTQLAYRLGETSSPNDSTTLALRLEWLNQGYLTTCRRKDWWFLEATDTSNTNTGSTTGYNLPTDYKKTKQLKIGNIYYDQIPFEDNRIYQGTGVIVTLPTIIKSYKFYTYAGKYYLIPIDSADSTIHTHSYYKHVAKIASGGTFLMPDEYLEGIVAFAEARYWMSITQQAKAAAPYQEFEEMVQEMSREHSRRSSGSSGFNIGEPEDQR